MKKKLIISICAFMLSVFAYNFFANTNQVNAVYAAEPANVIECNTLLDGTADCYEANVTVGTVTGLGKFVVGSPNKTITATAKSNYQLVGWKIDYDEQDVDPIFVDKYGLTGNSKIIELTAKDGTTKINATLTFEGGEYFSSGSFTIARVFEDLTVTPVFDHIYYQVAMKTLEDISILTNKVDIDATKMIELHYEKSEVEGPIKTYSNAYIRFGNLKTYYYDTIYHDSSDDSYYTIHKQLTAAGDEEKINYARGGFRFGDEVNINFKVADGFNIDLISAFVNNVSLGNRETITDLTNFNATTPDFNKWIIHQDSSLRTTNYKIRFKVAETSNYENSVSINKHFLYLVDIDLYVDDELDSGEEQEDILGNYTLDSTNNKIISNININNFYSIKNEDALQFYVKQSKDNGYKTFSISSRSKITNSEGYEYYNLEELDGKIQTSASYPLIASEKTVEIKYEAVKYDVSFSVKEYNINNSKLEDMAISIPTEQFVRGSEKPYNANNMKNFIPAGYQLKGFSLDGANFNEEINCVISETKPTDYQYIMALEKITYDVYFANFNKCEHNSNYALTNITFNKNGESSETLNQANLTSDPQVLDTKMRLNDELNISFATNAGFVVHGFKINSNADYLTDNKFILNNDFLLKAYTDSSNWASEWETLYVLKDGYYLLNISDRYDENVDYYTYENPENITINIHEAVKEYTLTYLIRPSYDQFVDGKVIMAAIDIDQKIASDEVTITKYEVVDLNANELVYAPIDVDDTTSLVAKIEVSGLKHRDKVKLTSEGFTKGEGTSVYTYMWRNFTEAGKNSPLSADQVGNKYTCTNLITKDITIEVVYTMPQATIQFGYADGYSDSVEYEVVVSQAGSTIELKDGAYKVATDSYVTFEISNVSYGYVFYGYVVNNEGTENLLPSGSHIVNNYEVRSGSNNVKLIFKEIKYKLKFAQYGCDDIADGTLVEFESGVTNKEITITNLSVEVNKPKGYYVSTTTFGKTSYEGLSSEMSENNDIRNNDNNDIYTFELTEYRLKSLIDSLALGIQTFDGYYNDITIELLANLTYLKYEYIISVNFAMNDSKGDYDNRLTPPSYTLVYEQGEQTIEITKRDQNAVFTNIEYGAKNAKIVANYAGVTAGVKLIDTLWVENRKGVYNKTLGEITKDETITHLHEYENYFIQIDYPTTESSPIITHNDNEIAVATLKSSGVEIFDSLKIKASENRLNGYKVVSIGFIKKLNLNEDNWDSADKNNLYRKDGSQFIKIEVALDYDSTLEYYTYQVVDSSEIQIGEFAVRDDYYIDENNTMYVKIIYEILKFKIVNLVDEIGSWSSVGDNWEIIGQQKILIPKSEVATISVNVSGRTIQPEELIEFGKTITIELTINSNAQATVDGVDVEYDLTKGLLFDSIQGPQGLIDNTGNCKLNIVLAANIVDVYSEVLNLKYSLEPQFKTIQTTTIIQDNSFYKFQVEDYDEPSGFTYVSYVSMSNDALGYGGSTSYSGKNSSISSSRSFLTKCLVSCEIVDLTRYGIASTTTLEVSGYTIYSSGTKITEDKYNLYGIEQIEDASGVSRNKVRLSVQNNLKVVFNISPIVAYNTEDGNPNFTSEFDCDKRGNGIVQELTIGTDEPADIIIPSFLIDYVEISYTYNGIEEEVKDCKVYDVVLNIAENSWFNELVITERITFTITQKEITLTYDNLPKKEKIYDGTSSVDISDFENYLIFTDGEDFIINYSDVLADRYEDQSTPGPDYRFKLNNSSDGPAFAFTTYGVGENERTADANHDVYYNVCYQGFSLLNNTFNNNFKIANSSLLLEAYIKILKKDLEFKTLFEIYNKVYDGTTDAIIKTQGEIDANSIISGDDISIDSEKVEVRFKDASVGRNKEVEIDVSKALTGEKMKNYQIKHEAIKGLTIYPDQLSTSVDGFGEVKLMNIRGKTELDKVDLIPLNSQLIVSPVYADSVEYAHLYGTISEHLKGNKEFVVGYNISLNVDGENQPISKQLHLSVPYVEDMLGMYFLSNDTTGELAYTKEGDYFIIDLSQLDSDEFTGLFSTKKRILLKVWQIVLIIVTAVLIVAAVVLTLIIVRRRKSRAYSVHDTI